MEKAYVNMDNVPPKPATYRRPILWVSVAIIALQLAVIIGLAVAFSQLARNYTRQQQLVAAMSSVDTETIVTAGRVAQYLDPSVEPCSNFYRYSCNGFLASHYVPDLLSGDTSVISTLTAQRTNELTRILYGDRDQELETRLFGADPQLRTVYQAARRYYSTCNASVNFYVQSALGDQGGSFGAAVNALSQNITKYVLDAIRNDTAYATMHSQMANLDLNAVIQVRQVQTIQGGLPSWIVQPQMAQDPTASAGDTTPPVLLLGPTMLAAGQPLTQQSNVTAYSQFIAQVLHAYVRPAVSVQNLQATALKLAKFEQAIWQAQAAYPAPDSFTDWVRISAAQMDQQYPAIMSGNSTATNWLSFLRDIGFSASDSQSVSIYVSSPQYFDALNLLFRSTPTATVLEYGRYAMAMKLGLLAQLHGYPLPGISLPLVPIGYSPALLFSMGKQGSQHISKFIPTAESLVKPSHVVDYHFSQFSDPTSTPRDSSEELSSQTQILVNQQCLADVMEQFPLVLGRIYHDLVMPDATKQAAVELVKNVRQAYAERMQNVNTEPWLDEQSRAAALKKLAAIKEMILLPDLGKNSAAMLTFYGDSAPLISDNLLSNMIVATQQLNKVQCRYWTSMDAADLYFLASTDWTAVNAFYEQTSNHLVLPMGLLHPVNTSPKSSLAMTYGLMGTVIGHELTHAFDNQGVKYDELGQHQDLFEPITETRFTTLTHCFESFFGRYTNLGIRIDGAQTLGENIADNGGLQVSWDAYQKVRDAANPARLPGLSDLDEDKMFWLGFSQFWCSSSVDSVQAYAQATDVHTIASVRVNAGLALSDDFQSVWKCDSNSFMAPATQCKLWRR